MLIINAEIWGVGGADLIIENGRIAKIGKGLTSNSGQIIDAQHGALLPGLHDHHMHLLSTAASLRSIFCGPPKIKNDAQFIELLNNAEPGEDGWIRGMAYHEAIGPDIDRHWLDRYGPDCPIRIQHRSGAAWIFNSLALDKLGLKKIGLAKPKDKILLPEGIERGDDGDLTGRLFHMDQWLAERMPTMTPSLAAVSHMLASFGVTGITDATPRNGPAEWQLIATAQDSGELLQRVMLMGNEQLEAVATDVQAVGSRKIYLKEKQLPGFEQLVEDIQIAHRQSRSVAFHCVTRTELIYALSCLAAADTDTGIDYGDRIEHASITDHDSLELLADQGVTVVTQPNFIYERGDQYLLQVEAGDHQNLYRGKAFLDAGIPLAAGTDAPFGDPDPWKAMRAAVDRCTESGVVLGDTEKLTAEQALSLFLGSAGDPGAGDRKIEVGQPADFCLLKKPWNEAREHLHNDLVQATIRGGQFIYQR